MALLRRRLRCHYCNTLSRDTVSQIPKTFHCPQCDAVNHFDERGNITDPPIEEVATAPQASFQHLRSRSPTPAMSVPGDDIFCDTCQRNQTLYAKLLGEYLPEEDDPTYGQFLAAYEDYKDELETRYPQVCSECLPRVQHQIRNANHIARADNLARIMEASKQKRTTVHTHRQAWTLRFISLAKWTYVVSTAIGIVWHAAGLYMGPDEGIRAYQVFSWDTCWTQAKSGCWMDEICVLSPVILKWLNFAIIADALTIWWNPKLKLKTNSLTGRMRGLMSLWMIRITAVALRFLTLYYWKGHTINNDTLTLFRYTHVCMLGILTFSSIMTWKAVRIVYGAAPSFLKTAREPVPSAPDSAQKARRGSYHPAHPQASVFDSIAPDFANGMDQCKESSPLPPSPTISEASFTTHATDVTTPYAQRSTFLGADDMDWTPTKNSGSRFSSQPPEIIPNHFSKTTSRQPATPPRFREPHSIFSKPDPNPFRHRVPAPPPPSLGANQKPNPWKPSVWAPPLKENVPKFFKGDQKAQGGAGEIPGLDGFGVPKNVKRDAELFASPKLKYEYYGTMKDTGLEDTFNAMFTK
ncbi:uncharacterized protein J4E78_003187 [Alternaria triticimaculans]|uniref:uncharacterized protein n=1 Tax=Alternaria triticimaculans TaxID=297637 RepID=UPI0020C218A3|nr:uncharacterized protein J4E78_003187 [Alternaria triticimaculans]KAI4665722.1 hypothetical protein J4E78_003187 [Alternaria triticimaculans]